MIDKSVLIPASILSAQLALKSVEIGFSALFPADLCIGKLAVKFLVLRSGIITPFARDYTKKNIFSVVFFKYLDAQS